MVCEEIETIGMLDWLLGNTEKLLKSPFISFDNTKKLTSSGIYAIYEKDKILYIGRTGRQGKERLRNLTGDFLSHTLNRTLLIPRLNEKLNFYINKLNSKDDKQKLIDSGKITEAQFREIQKELNDYIKNNFKIKFIRLYPEEAFYVEHFAIAVLHPEYNKG